MTRSQQKIFQVSEINQKVRMLLEGEFLNVWITGEISNFVKASSGHWYFSLKDNKAQIKSAMFKMNNRQVSAQIQEGSQVIVRGRLSLYEPRGDYQLIAEFMEPAGEGLLKQQFEQLKNQLAQMGLFDQDVKRPIPRTPKRVGVVTSATGAAIHDILTVLKRRSPQTEIIIYPTMVQGEYAAQNIIWAIDIANHRQEVDVLIVGRGGGSLEDLWPFNDEALAHTIYNSALPIISAVGHEVDVSISDYVADMRAPTPSAAAELVSTDLNEVKNYVNQLYSRLLTAYTQHYKSNKVQQQHLTQSLYLLHPQHQLNHAQQKLDEFELRLKQLLTDRINKVKQKHDAVKHSFLTLTPLHNINNQKTSLLHLSQRLRDAQQRELILRQNKYQNLIEKLNIVSPLATLARGYSITRDESGQIIHSPDQVTQDQNLTVNVQHGKIAVKVQ